MRAYLRNSFCLLLSLAFALASADPVRASGCSSLPSEASFLASLNETSQRAAARLEVDPTLAATCFKQVSCGPYPPVACAGRACTAVQRDCALGEAGSVTCAGVTTSCPRCPGTCPEGLRSFVATGYCCDGDRAEVDVLECRGGEFVYLSTVCGSEPCGGPMDS